MRGRIIKGVGGFYYVHTDRGLYTCRAKGLFRLDHTKPLVGDYVEMDVVPGEDMVGNVSRIYDRKNQLERPNVANVDQALIIFALLDPVPNLVTLDKMILQYKAQGIPVLICFNKEDIAKEELAESFGIEFLYRDFRVGFREGQAKAREMGLYMQKYCGCIFSEEDSIAIHNDALDNFIDRVGSIDLDNLYSNFKNQKVK